MTVQDESHKPETPPTPQEVEARRNAYRISLTTTIVMMLIAIAAATLTIYEGKYAFHGSIVMAVTGILAFYSFRLVNRGHYQAGIVTLCIEIMLAGVSLAFLSKIPIIGMGIFIVVSGISTYALMGRLAGWMTAASFLVGIISALVAIFGSQTSLYVNQTIAYILIGILSLIYIFFIVRRYPRFSVRTKLAFFTLVVVIVPMTMLTILHITQQTARLQADLEAQLLRTATLAANDLDNFLAERRSVVMGEAQLPDIVSYLQMSPEERKGSETEARVAKILSAYRTKDSAYTLSYALLDTNGIVLVDTSVNNIGQSEADYSYFLPPLVNGYPYISPIEYIGENQQPQITFSAPVFNTGAKVVGVLRARYTSNILHDRLKSILENQPAGVYGVLVDERFLIRIVHTADPTLTNKTYLPLDKDTISRLQKSRRLPSNVAPDEIEDNNPALAAGLTNSDLKPIFQAASILPDKQPEYIGTARTHNANWIVAVHQPTALITQPITAQTNSSIVLSIFAASIALLLVFGLSQAIVMPLRMLTASAEQVAAGNLNVEAKVSSQDEIGILATAFNTMTAQLREVLFGLEQRVAERTAELEQMTAQSNQRADRLQTISDVARIIAGEQNVETLLPLITNIVSERFGFYHVGVFLNDETNTFARLRAANSEGGKRMLNRGHRLRIGEEGIVGYVTSVGKARMALDVGEDAVFFNNPDLPDTRSEMALPLIARGRIIGALDIQSTVAGAFKPEDTSILQILADQIAIAIENARLYEQTRQALDEIKTLNRQYLTEKWQSATARRAVIGFYHSLNEETRPISRPVDHKEIRRAIETGTIAIANPDENAQQKSALAVPVSIRGETLAAIHVQSNNPNRRWTQSELALLQAVAERVAAALETARLFEESEKRAQKEKIISDISARIGATVDFQNILHTAAEELGRAIPGSEVVIQLQQNEK